MACRGLSVCAGPPRQEHDMAIATINPATGETVRTYDEIDGAGLECKLSRAAATFREYRSTSFVERARWLRGAAEVLDADSERLARMMTTEMGKADPRGARGGGQVRLGMPVLRRPCGGDARRARGRRRARVRVRSSPTTGRGARRDALELPFLAGLPLRRSRAHGRQRRSPEARVQRAGVCCGDRGALAPGGLPGRRLPDAPHRLQWRRRHRRGSTRRSRNAHRLEHGGPARGQPCRRMPQEERDGAWRQRSVCRHAVCGHGGGGKGGGAQPDHQQRPVVHRGQALHRRGRDLR